VTEAGGRERRGAVRIRVSILAHAREPKQAPFPVQVIDLSTDGCRIAGRFHLEQAIPIWLRIPGLTPRSGTIAWSRSDLAGCAFDEPVSEAAVESVTRTLVR
jgi:hypothetical protein